MKPTFGLIPYTGIIASETSIDHTGPMTRDVMSSAVLLQAVAGVDGLDDRQLAGTPFRDQVPDYPALLAAAKSAGALLSVAGKGTSTAPGEPRKLRVGILKEGEMASVMDPRIATLCREAAKKFADLGAEVVEVSVPGHLKAATIARAYRFTQSNIFLGRMNGTRQVYLNDLTEKMLPWTQEKFDKVSQDHATRTHSWN